MENAHTQRVRCVRKYTLVVCVWGGNGVRDDQSPMWIVGLLTASHARASSSTFALSGLNDLNHLNAKLVLTRFFFQPKLVQNSPKQRKNRNVSNNVIRKRFRGTTRNYNEYNHDNDNHYESDKLTMQNKANPPSRCLLTHKGNALLASLIFLEM